MTREELVERWFELTREELPALAREHGWPVHLDHCFQRVLLDNACRGHWKDAIAPPAYRNASEDQLREAIRLGEAAAAGEADMAALNRRSLAWRGKP